MHPLLPCKLPRKTFEDLRQFRIQNQISIYRKSFILCQFRIRNQISIYRKFIYSIICTNIIKKTKKELFLDVSPFSLAFYAGKGRVRNYNTTMDVHKDN